jgi:hypothetical protein
MHVVISAGLPLRQQPSKQTTPDPQQPLHSSALYTKAAPPSVLHLHYTSILSPQQHPTYMPSTMCASVLWLLSMQLSMPETAPGTSCRRHLPKQQHILQLGVGTSRLQEDMADDGYCHIISIDYSPVAIQRLQQTYPSRPQLEYAVADARAMPQYESSSCGGVLVSMVTC